MVITPIKVDTYSFVRLTWAITVWQLRALVKVLEDSLFVALRLQKILSSSDDNGNSAFCIIGIQNIGGKFMTKTDLKYIVNVGFRGTKQISKCWEFHQWFLDISVRLFVCFGIFRIKNYYLFLTQNSYSKNKQILRKGS